VGRFRRETIGLSGGGLLLTEVEAKTHTLERLAEPSNDHRDP